ncbi:MAG TPA: MFS transporter [Bryobacteraceae bacterium]|nr:MFS transporter [Bryobacteraceae bacterium]
MAAFFDLIKQNRNYRWMWLGQVVSEVGDHFNNIAVFSLAMKYTGSGLVITGIMLSRAIPAILVGPMAGVLLDRWDRRRIMIISDLVRALVAFGFMLSLAYPSSTLLYVLSALLMVASPFFTAGRSAILPRIASKQELHTANSMTQTTGWTTLTIGTFAGGASVAQFGFEWAFLLNTLSFLFSALCIMNLSAPGGFKVNRNISLTENDILAPFRDYRQGLAYMARNPLILGIALVSVGWATGGGAAQVLFTIFGEVVFNRGPAGIGYIWGSAGLGLLVGGFIAHRLGGHVPFERYKLLVSVCYLLHGGAYIVFSQMQSFLLACFFIGLSRAAVAITSVLNMSQLLRHVSDEYRGRVFSTIETMNWTTMMVSMMMAGIASTKYSPRDIGAVAGILSSSTAVFWGLANYLGKLPEPPRLGVEPEEVEVHGEPTV